MAATVSMALAELVREAYVDGVSTRKADDLVKALGPDGISKSQVSRVCETLDEEVAGFRRRPLEGTCPNVWLDPAFVEQRDEPQMPFLLELEKDRPTTASWSWRSPRPTRTPTCRCIPR
jgi:transposase-like protein